MSGGEAEEEDWFEKALSESDEESAAQSETEAETSSDSGESTDEVETAGDTAGAKSPADTDPTDHAQSDGPTDDADSPTAEPAPETDGDPFGGESTDDDTKQDSFGGDVGDSADDSDGEDPFGGGAESTTDDPFGGDADDPFGGDTDDTADESGDEEPFGGDATDTADDSGGEDPFGGGGDATDTADDSGGEDPFGGTQSGASTDTEDPFGGGPDGGGDGGFGGGGSGGAGVDDPTTGGADPFGGAQTEESGPDDNPFGEDFADAMGGGDMGGGMGGGFGGGGGSDPAEFEDEEFESDIDRLDIGIEGLDDMILGGVPVRSLMTVIGSAGTGKTTFGLQFLNQAMANGGSGVYITLEETEEAIVSTAEEKGWPFGEYIEDDKLVVVSMDPIEMANSLDSIRGDISRLVTNFGADRLVLDSVSLLEMMYDHPAKRRSEVFDFARSLKGAGVTTMLTSEANADNSYQSRHGLVEYLVDAVFVLQYVRPSDFQETRLAVEIQKIRDANHSRETKPYDITDDGISVYRQANIF